MSLACGCDIDGDYPTVHNEKWVRARKAHKCGECRRPIQPGDEYRYTFMVFDGDARSYHTCEACAGIADALVGLGFCWDDGDLRSAYIQYLREYTNAVRVDEETGDDVMPHNHLTEGLYRTYRA